jgi:predicted phage-related endonuclease
MEALQTERHPRVKQNVVEYDFSQTKEYDIYAAAKEYKELQRQVEKLKAEMEETKQVIIENMAGRETVIAREYKISYKSFPRTSLDTDALKSVHPDIYKLFSKTSTTTRFTVD